MVFCFVLGACRSKFLGLQEDLRHQCQGYPVDAMYLVLKMMMLKLWALWERQNKALLCVWPWFLDKVLPDQLT